MRLIFQENVRTIFPLSDFHVTAYTVENLVIDVQSDKIGSGRRENHHTSRSCELLCFCLAPCCCRKEEESGRLQSRALCVLAKSFRDGPISFPNVWSWWCCWCSKDSLANGFFLLTGRTRLWKHSGVCLFPGKVRSRFQQAESLRPFILISHPLFSLNPERVFRKQETSVKWEISYS